MKKKAIHTSNKEKAKIHSWYLWGNKKIMEWEGKLKKKKVIGEHTIYVTNKSNWKVLCWVSKMSINSINLFSLGSKD